MNECCWYETNVTTLWRYAKNRMRYMPYDPETDIGRLFKPSYKDLLQLQIDGEFPATCTSGLLAISTLSCPSVLPVRQIG